MYLDSIYLNASSGGSFSSPSKLLYELKRRNYYRNVGLKTINDYLNSKPEYSVYKQSRNKFPRPKIYVSGINMQLQVDLLDVRRFMDDNNQIGYILVCIDCFSRFLNCEPLINKSSKVVVPAMARILNRYKTLAIETDRGAEFLDASYQNMLSKRNIRHFFSGGSTHSAIVERVNRTIRLKISRLQRFRNSDRYIDKLQDIVHSYNHTYHRSIKMMPIDVDLQNEYKVYDNLYGNIKLPKHVKYKYKVGDFVRIAKEHGIFKKSFKQKFSEEIFSVSRRYSIFNIALYKINDCKNEEIIGSYFSDELTMVNINDTSFDINKVLEGPTMRDGTMQIKVNFLHQPNSCSEWIPFKNLKNIKKSSVHKNL